MDLWDRNSPALEVDISLPGRRVVRTLERLRLHGRLSDACRMMLPRIALEKRLPFGTEEPNEVSLAAIKEIENGKPSTPKQDI